MEKVLRIDGGVEEVEDEIDGGVEEVEDEIVDMPLEDEWMEKVLRIDGDVEEVEDGVGDIKELLSTDELGAGPLAGVAVMEFESRTDVSAACLAVWGVVGVEGIWVLVWRGGFGMADPNKLKFEELEDGKFVV